VKIRNSAGAVHVGADAITIDTIAGDDVIDIDEAADLITLSGKLNLHDNTVNPSVTVSIDGARYDTVVNPTASSWSLQVAGNLLATAATATVTATLHMQDAVGNLDSINASRSYMVAITATAL
jgi:hypothetical protein